MDEFDSGSLQKIGKGTMATFGGLLVGLVLTFISYSIIAHYVTVAEYGLFSLSLAVITIVAMLSTIGLEQTIPRYIAYFQARGRRGKVSSTIALSIQFVLMASIPLSLAVFFSAEQIATTFFRTPELAFPLRMFALGVPCLALVRVITSIYRGFGRVDVKVYFSDLLRSVLFPLFLVVVIVCGLSFHGVVYAYPMSLVFTLVALVVYSTRNMSLVPAGLAQGDMLLRRELLLFCLPVLGALALGTARSYTSIILIGFFKTPTLAGLYNAASPLAEFMLVTSTAMSLIYVPVTSGLYAKGLMGKFRRDYTVLIKWISAVSLPLFLVLVLFPETVLGFVFGAEYVSAVGALRILSSGFFVANLLSLANFSLISVGRPRLLMWALLIAVVLCIALGIALIPPFGLVGAATASAVSVVVAEIICSVWLYRLTGAQPFSWNLLKPFIASLLSAAAVYFVAVNFFKIAIWMLPVFFAVFCLIYVLAVLFTRSFDREDIVMLLVMEKKAGINATPVKRFLGRFITI